MRAMRARIAAFSAASSTTTGAAGAGASARAGTARPARSKAQSFGAKGVLLGLLAAARHDRAHVVPKARYCAEGFSEFKTDLPRRPFRGGALVRSGTVTYHYPAATASHPTFT